MFFSNLGCVIEKIRAKTKTTQLQKAVFLFYTRFAPLNQTTLKTIRNYSGQSKELNGVRSDFLLLHRSQSTTPGIVASIPLIMAQAPACGQKAKTWK